MAFSVTCPHCQAVLKSAGPIAGGKTVRCAKCGQAFETPAMEDATAVSAAPPAMVPLTLDDPPAAEAPEDRPRKRRDDDDDEPRERKRRDRDDDADDAPRIRKRKRAKGNALPITIGLVILGLGFLAVGCVGCGGLGYWLYTIFGRHPIVGRWEQTEPQLGQRVVNTFDPDGKGSAQIANVTIAYKYRIEGNTLTLEPSQKLGGAFGGGIERFNVQINGDNMTLTRTDNPQLIIRELKFRRLR